jgi:hypothetical protein
MVSVTGPMIVKSPYPTPCEVGRLAQRQAVGGWLSPTGSRQVHRFRVSVATASPAACRAPKPRSNYTVALSYSWMSPPSTSRRPTFLSRTYRGTVALAEAGARWTHTLGQVSDDESQFSERVGQTEG